MELYIGNIPDGVDDYDLRKLFQVTGEQASFRIVNRDGEHGRARRYGLVSLQTEGLGRQLIKRFNGVLFRDRRLSVRPFTHRNYSNERRALNWREQDWDKTERRMQDRRGVLIPGRRVASEGKAVFALG